MWKASIVQLVIWALGSFRAFCGPNCGLNWADCPWSARKRYNTVLLCCHAPASQHLVWQASGTTFLQDAATVQYSSSSAVLWPSDCCMLPPANERLHQGFLLLSTPWLATQTSRISYREIPLSIVLSMKSCYSAEIFRGFAGPSSKIGAHYRLGPYVQRNTVRNGLLPLCWSWAHTACLTSDCLPWHLMSHRLHVGSAPGPPQHQEVCATCGAMLGRHAGGARHTVSWDVGPTMQTWPFFSMHGFKAMQNAFRKPGQTFGCRMQFR